MGALRTVVTMLDHGVEQLRDAGDETRVQLVMVVNSLRSENQRLCS